METPTLLRCVLIVSYWLPLVTCGHGASQPVARTVKVETFPEEMVRHPGERFHLMLRLRKQILQKTRHLPGDRWWMETRPALRRQLEEAGLAPDDAEFLLGEVDRTR